ncbi:MAG TPA: DUF5684 domain-containing protein [Tepidisphaeraceae bacterium]|jgi:hypothetical protein|nr:DUF5684 domain-containing protein [Tepidisphaeraceae bacterium]
MIVFVIELAIIVVAVAGMWKAFEKAGKPGWAAIIPIYNLIVILEIAGKPLWWIILSLIPIVNIVAAILIFIAFAEKYGKSAGFGVGLALLGFVFFPILGFGDAQYGGAQPQGFAPVMPGQ